MLKSVTVDAEKREVTVVLSLAESVSSTGKSTLIAKTGGWKEAPNDGGFYRGRQISCNCNVNVKGTF